MRLRSWNDAHTPRNESPCDDVGRMLKIAESSPLRYSAFIQGVDKLREGGSLADFRDKKNYDKCKAALLEQVMATPIS
jgi:hypothetical protein